MKVSEKIGGSKDDFISKFLLLLMVENSSPALGMRKIESFITDLAILKGWIVLLSLRFLIISVLVSNQEFGIFNVFIL